MTIETLSDSAKMTNNLIVMALKQNKLPPDTQSALLAANEKLVLMRHEIDRLIRNRVYERR